MAKRVVVHPCTRPQLPQQPPLQQQLALDLAVSSVRCVCGLEIYYLTAEVTPSPDGDACIR